MKNTLITLTMTLMMVTIIMSAAQPVNAEMIPDDLSSGIQISEFLYDPSCPELDGEFIEIQNIALCPVNLLNWTLSDQDGDIDLFFPNIILHSGQMAVIFSGHGDLTIDQATGSYILHMNKSSSLLTNTGDDILLANATGSPMDFISFGDGSSTDLPPSGFNGSVPLSFIPEGMSYSRQGNNWSQSIPTPGSLPHSIDGILITGLCPDVKGGGEFIEITNPTAKAIDLAHCAITDGEGMAIFPSGTTIAPGESLAIADNGTRYHELTMEFPNLSYTGDSISGNMEIPGTRPMLANDGDEVFIIDAGLNKVDTLAYGDSIYLGEGWTGRPIMELDAYQIIRRVCLDGIYLDTDSVDDWNELKPLRMGQSNHTIQTIESSGNVGAFVSPDCSMEALLAEIEGASHSISLNVYEFTNRYLANALNDAMIRGVEVKILVDGSPVGGMSDAEVEALSFLANSGAEVHLMNPKDPKVESRYNFNHAKYLIIDDITSIIMTENWKMSGVPIEGTVGNRGWGVIIHDSEIAGYYSNLFSGDWNPAWEDVTIFEPLNVMDLPVWYGVDQTIVPIFEPTLSLTPSRITPVVYPDMSLGSDDPVLGMLDGAKSSILVEEFYIDLHWGARGIDGEWTQINPYLQAVVDAARRGCSVRILLDSTDYNIKFDDYNDNDNTVAYINSLADEEGLDMEAKLGRSGSHIFTKIHAKGLVVDASQTLVSSINWNENSCTRNREVGVIVENQDIASYFTEVFNHDWQDFVQISIPTPVIEASGTFSVNSTISFSAVNSVSENQIINYSWDMDSDGVVDGYGANIFWQFPSAGQYNISIMVVDENGTRNTATLMLNITSQLSLEVGEDTPIQVFSTSPVPEGQEILEGGLSNDIEADGDSDKTGDLIILLLPILALAGMMVYQRLNKKEE